MSSIIARNASRSTLWPPVMVRIDALILEVEASVGDALREAAVDDDVLGVDPRRHRAGQEGDDVGDLVGATESLGRMLVDVLLVVVGHALGDAFPRAAVDVHRARR